MRSYQILSVIGGVLGMVIVFLVYVVMGSLFALSSAFGGKGEISDGIYAQIGISIILYIIAIIIPLVINAVYVQNIVLLWLLMFQKLSQSKQMI